MGYGSVTAPGASSQRGLRMSWWTVGALLATCSLLFYVVIQTPTTPPADLCASDFGTVIVADGSKVVVWRQGNERKYESTARSVAATNDGYVAAFPTSVVVEPEGRRVVDNDGPLVVARTVYATATTLKSLDGTLVANATAAGLAVAADGTVYFTDARRGTLNRVMPGGRIDVIASGLKNPQAVALTSTTTYVVLRPESCGPGSASALAAYRGATLTHLYEIDACPNDIATCGDKVVVADARGNRLAFLNEDHRTPLDDPVAFLAKTALSKSLLRRPTLAATVALDPLDWSVGIFHHQPLSLDISCDDDGAGLGR